MQQMTIQQITDALQKNAPDGFYIKYVKTYDESDKTGEKITVKDIVFVPPFYEYDFGKDGNNIALAVAATDKNIYVQEKKRSGFDLLSTIKPDKAFFKKVYKIWSDKYLNFTEQIKAEVLAAAPNGFKVEIQNISGDNTDKLDAFIEKIDVKLKWETDPPAGVATLKQKFSGLSHDFGFYRNEFDTAIIFKKGLFETGFMELKKGLKALSELIDPSLTSTKAPSMGGGGGRVTTQYYTQSEQEKIQKAVSESTPENVQVVFKGGRTAQAVRIYPLAGSLKGRKAFNNRLPFGETRPKFADDNINQVAKSFAEDVARFVKRTPTDAEYLANPEILKRGTANKEFRVKKTLDAVRKEKRESNKKSVARGRGKERGKGDGADSPTRAVSRPIDSQIESVEFVEPPQESGGRMTRRKTIKAGQADKRAEIKNILGKGRAKRATNGADLADNAEMIETPAKVAKARKARAAGLVRGAYKESVKRIMQKIRTREKAIEILKNEIKALS